MEKRQKTRTVAIENEPIEGDELFLSAMADVKPICRKNVLVNPPVSPQRAENISICQDEDRDAVQALKELVARGDGFMVSHTPEYMEGTNFNAHPEISRQLHKGRFSIQAHIDLHGMSVSTAGEAFNVFMKKAVISGQRALLIIHGRGLSSPKQPILKSKVYEWLTQGPWRKWVIAFASARPCDGGAGATVVLLRKTPLTRRYRKKITAR